MTARTPAASGCLRIGEVAERVRVSERTLRYYEELGLVTPSEHTPGGNRRYTEDDVARVEQIRHLQSLVGFNLDEIRLVLDARDRLDALRDAGRCPARERQSLLASVDAVIELRDTVSGKLERLHRFHDELDAKIARYRQLVRAAP